MMTLTTLALMLALATPAPNLLLAAGLPKRTLIRSVPAGNVYASENVAGKTVEEDENRHCLGREACRAGDRVCEDTPRASHRGHPQRVGAAAARAAGPPDHGVCAVVSGAAVPSM